MGGLKRLFFLLLLSGCNAERIRIHKLKQKQRLSSAVAISANINEPKLKAKTSRVEKCPRGRWCEDIQETELILNAGGDAIIHDNSYGDDGRSDAIMWGGKTQFSGSWTETQPGHYTLMLTKKTTRKWTTYPGNKPRDTELSHPATLKVVVVGSQVDLLELQNLKLLHTELTSSTLPSVAEISANIQEPHLSAKISKVEKCPYGRWCENIEETALILNVGGEAIIHNNDYGDDGRSDAIMWGGKTMFSGTWTETQPGHYSVTLTKKTTTKWTIYPGNKPRDEQLSPPATLKVVVVGSQVELLELQNLNLLHTELANSQQRSSSATEIRAHDDLPRLHAKASKVEKCPYGIWCENIQETELILRADGDAIIYNNDYGDDGRSDAIMWGDKFRFAGTWSEMEPEHYIVTLTKKNNQKMDYISREQAPGHRFVTPCNPQSGGGWIAGQT